MSSKKHYTEVEKKAFLGILRKFSHIIENKKSDSSSLKMKEDAWHQIAEQYNMSAVISSKRNVTQLKKMRSNMKCSQRNNTMKEKQFIMATGGGPAECSFEINPGICEIVPTLMETAPSTFSSNCADEVMIDSQNAIFEGEIAENIIELDDENENRTVECRKDEIDVIVDDALQRQKQSKKGTVNYAQKIVYDERRLKLERIRRIMKNEEELADLKLRHEQFKNKLEIEFLKEKYTLDIRAAKAATKKAEFELKCEQEIDEY